MTRLRGKAFATTWDDWNHPKRVIAAIWIVTFAMLGAFILLAPVLDDHGVSPTVSVVAAFVIIIATISLIGPIMARFD